MPAIAWDSCPPDWHTVAVSEYVMNWNGEIIFREPDDIVRLHGNSCPLISRHKNGFWRWFISSTRCECPCHNPKSVEYKLFPTLNLSELSERGI